jgi:transcriptional regulator with XRE-family HTH domain
MDINQAEAAQRLGMPTATYSSYENGVSPKLETLVTLSTFYGVSSDYLLGLSNETKTASGELGIYIAQLMEAAGESAPTSSELAALMKEAIRYYRRGAPCGDIPMKSLRGFVEGLRSALCAATAGETPALIDNANAAVVSALEITKMPAAFLNQKKGE